VILWALLSFPQPKPGETALDSSIAGKLASGLETIVRPIGFNHEIALALIPAMAAREVAVSALATAYSIEESEEGKVEKSLTDQLRGRWSLATALAFLAWFVFAPQCLSTIAVTRRETNGWRWPPSCWPICSASPIWLRAQPIGRRSPSVSRSFKAWRAASTRSFWSAISATIPNRARSAMAARS
jgi:hypothetical protein